MKDISIYYSGGSGGFIALHSVLLTDHYFCSFEGIKFLTDSNFSINFDYIKNKQWSVNLNTSPDSLWKSSEVWPDNNGTLTASSARAKVYFYCNLFQEPVKGESVLIYTDIESQIKLCKLKKAAWYNYIVYPPHTFWQDSYYAIKANSWSNPADFWSNSVTLATSLSEIPEYQQAEVLTRLAKRMSNISNVAKPNNQKIVTEEEILAKSKALSNGLVVEGKVSDFYDIADHRILLQDLVNTDGKILSDAIGVQHTDNHKLLFNKWRSLHSLEFLKSIGING